MLALVLAISLLFGLSAACGGGSSTETPEESAFDKKLVFTSAYGASITSSCPDGAGGMWVVGWFKTDIIINAVAYIAQHDVDIFAARIAADGTIIVVATAGGDDEDTPLYVCTDNSGGCWIAGMFESDCKFDTITINASGTDDVFLAHLDNAGLWVSAVRVGSNATAVSSEFVYGICSDGGTGCWLSVSHKAALTLGTITIPAPTVANSFVAKINNAGTWTTATEITSTHTAKVAAICTDGAGGFWAAGFYNQILTLGDDTLVANTDLTDTTGDIFIARADNDGEWLNSVSPLGTFNLIGVNVNLALTPASTGGVVVAGGFTGTAMFGTNIITAVGSTGKDAFIVKLNNSFEWSFVRSVRNVITTAISTTASGSYLITGLYDSTTVFGDYTLSSSYPEFFAAFITSTGTWTGAVTSRGRDYGDPYGIVETGANNWILGTFKGAVNFGDQSLSSNSRYSAFAVRTK